ncbi:hypothetical protein BC2230_120188 [Burkholderia cepacia]
MAAGAGVTLHLVSTLVFRTPFYINSISGVSGAFAGVAFSVASSTVDQGARADFAQQVPAVELHTVGSHSN